jgi:galactitol-specific phosphotransferase system IIB component
MAQSDDFLSIEASDAEEPVMMSEDAVAQAPLLPTVEEPAETVPVLPKPDVSFLASMHELANAFYRAVDQAQRDSTPDEADLLTSMHHLANTFKGTVDQVQQDPAGDDTGISSELADAFSSVVDQAKRDSTPDEADLLTSMHHLANSFNRTVNQDDTGISAGEANRTEPQEIDQKHDSHDGENGSSGEGDDEKEDEEEEDEDDEDEEDDEENGEDSKARKRCMGFPDVSFSPDDITIRDLLEGHMAVNCGGHEVQIPVLFSLMMMSIIGLSPATFFVAIGFGLPIVWLVRRGFGLAK